MSANEPGSWRLNSEELYAILDEETEESLAYAEARYWQGYEAGVAWAWMWFVLCIATLVALAMVLLFA